MRNELPGLILLALLLRLWAPSAVASAEPDLTTVSDPSSTRHYAFRLTVPAPELIQRADGTVDVALSGFDTPQRRVGAPDLPLRTVLIAIPQGATPRIEVRAQDPRFLPGLLPPPVPRRAIDPAAVDREALAQAEPEGRARILAEAARDRLERDPAVYAGDDLFPARPAWLGRIGVLRDQRYVEVHLSPVRYDPFGGGLLVHGALDVEVHFGVIEPVAFDKAPLTTDPRFESIYRGTFANYAQGLAFRSRNRNSRGVSSDGPQAQQPLGSSPRRRIQIRENGLIRLDHPRMTGSGFILKPLSTWRLTNRGTGVPLEIHDVNDDDILQIGDWVQFYGQALDDEPHAVLNTDIAHSDDDIFEARDFTDENVYFLTTVEEAQPAMPELDATPLNDPVPSHFEALAHEEVNAEDGYRPLGDADPWYWTPTLSLNFNTPDRTVSVPLPGLFSPSLPVNVQVHLRGVSSDALDPDHLTRVTLKNDADQVLATDDDTFEGQSLHLHDFDWDGSGAALGDPAKVRIEVRQLSDPQASNDVVLDYIELRYRRGFSAVDDELTFDWDNADSEFLVQGLADPAAQVYEITSGEAGVPIAPRRLTGPTVTGAGPYSVRFRVSFDPGLAPGESRRFVVAGAAAISTLDNADFKADSVSDLRDNAHQADMLVIGPDLLIDDAPGSVLAQYLDHRATAQGGGLTSKVVRLQDLEDEFNDGLPGPTGIREFLRWVMSTAPGEGWAEPRPAYVLLIGDASFDYKAGTTNGNYLSTQIMFKNAPELGYFASDNILAAVVGDDSLADLMIGRISGRSLSEVGMILQKIMDYETSPPAGSWRSHAFLMSDRGKHFSSAEALEFEAMTEQTIDHIGAPYTTRKLRYWTDICGASASGCNPTLMSNEIKSAIRGLDGFADGAAVAQFVGHGNFDLWSDDVVFCGNEASPFCPIDDTADLDNGSRLPWLIVHNCLTAGFHTPSEKSMGEQWIKQTGGAAVAVFAPTGLGFRYIGQVVIDSVYEDLFGPGKLRTIGPATLASQARLCGQNSIEACQYYQLLGDPATMLALPHVDPPTGVVVAPSHMLVDLSWTASGTPAVTYDVWRSESADGSYLKVNVAPIVGTTYADDSVENATDYFYYVVAVDAGGFDSAWSNFNSDCDVSGPDCVTALPLNPNPPGVPLGLTIADPETGGRLLVSWDANDEPDLDFYTLWVGTAPDDYDDAFMAGSSEFSLIGIENGVPYYFRVDATNTSGLTSPRSDEASESASFVLGLKPPALIPDLELGKSGQDALLSWTPITEDIYGKPLTVDFYEVFRDSSPGFVPSPAHRIGQSASASFVDVDALAPGNPDYHYLVRSVDVSGVGGGIGRQVPAAVLDLDLAWTGTAGNVLLSWTPVTTDFDSLPTTIDHYEIYASSDLFSRADICDELVAGCSGLTPIVDDVNGSSIELVPPPGNNYYSVLAVDTRGNKSPF